MGLITGAAGGVLRDVLCGEIPLIFRRSELYVRTTLGGCLHYVGAKAMGIPIAARRCLAWLSFLSCVLPLRNGNDGSPFLR